MTPSRLLLAALLLSAAVSCTRPTKAPPRDEDTKKAETKKRPPEAGASSAADRKRNSDNLKKLAHAMHAFTQSSPAVAMPASAIYGKDNKPLLSWRVALLPYLKEESLYKQFKLDEPWDSPRNKKLLSRMPKVYAPVRGKTKTPYSTFYQVFTGPETPFRPLLGPSMRANFPDGTSNTILIVEAGTPVPWAKPQDLPYDPKKPVPELGGLFPDGFHVALADATVKFIRRKAPEKELRALITAAGGEEVDWKAIPVLEPGDE